MGIFCSHGPSEKNSDRKQGMITTTRVSEKQRVLARNVKKYPLLMDIARSPGILTVSPTVLLLREQPAV
jgi:hypothetical protein